MAKANKKARDSQNPLLPKDEAGHVMFALFNDALARFESVDPDPYVCLQQAIRALPTWCLYYAVQQTGREEGVALDVGMSMALRFFNRLSGGAKPNIQMAVLTTALVNQLCLGALEEREKVFGNTLPEDLTLSSLLSTTILAISHENEPSRPEVVAIRDHYFQSDAVLRTPSEFDILRFRSQTGDRATLLGPVSL